MFYTTEEVAEKLKMDAETIRRFILAKKLKAYKIGTQWRIEEIDLNEFIKSGEVN